MRNAADDSERVLRSLYEHLSTMGEEEFFASIGLHREPSWHEYRRHYDHGGRLDLDRAFTDATEFPPTRARIEKLRAEFREVIERHRSVVPFRPKPR